MPPKTIQLAPDSELSADLRDASLTGEELLFDTGDIVYTAAVSSASESARDIVDTPAQPAKLREAQASVADLDAQSLREEFRRQGNGLRTTPERMSETFELRDEPAVAQFLARHPQVADGALLAANGLRAQFGPDARLALEVDTDPEDDLAQPRLFALVLTELGVEDALARLAAFRQQWWKETTPVLTEGLSVDVEMH